MAERISKMVKNRGLTQLLLVTFMAAFTLLILYLLFSRVDVKEMLDRLMSIGVGFIVVLTLLEAATILLMARRFQVILHYMGGRVPYLRCLWVNMATYPLIPVTPSISGNFIKVFYLRKESPTYMVAGSVIAERLFDMAALVLLVLLGLALRFNLQFFLAAILIIAALALLILFASWISGKFQKSILQKLDVALQIIVGLFRDPRSASTISIYSTAIWGLALAQIYLFFLAIGASVPFLSVLSNMPIAMLVGQIPVTIGGMGTRDGVMMQLFQGAMSYEQILAAGLMFSIFRYWLPAAAGLPFMLNENRGTVKSPEPAV